MARQFEIRIFDRPLVSWGSPEYRSNAISQMMRDSWLSKVFGHSTATGKRVNGDNALQISAVWACIQLLSNTTGVIPLGVYRKVNRGREPLTDHPTYVLLHRRPNIMMTSYTWRRSTMVQMAMNGNSYTRINRDPYTAKVVSLDFIPKVNSVQPFMFDGKVWYHIEGEQRPVPYYDMLHFKWNTDDGLIGKSPIAVARENIGQALAMQEYGSRIYSSGGSKRVALKSPAKMTDDQKESFRSTWEKKYAGVDKLNRIAILEGNAELVEVGMNPDDAQFVDSQKFKVEEIARIYGVPPHMIQHLEQSTNNNIEHQSMDFVTHTMMPHLVNMEQEIDFKLYENEPDVYSKFNVNSLLRADHKTRAIWYRAMMDLGVYSINEVREMEDSNPIEMGDQHHIQVNRMPLEKMNNMDSEEVMRAMVEQVMKRTNGHAKVTS